MNEAILEKIGLTQNESIVYLSLLQLGLCRTGKILEYSHLNSGKIYEILEGLKSKGLVSESVINNVRHFSAAPPSQLLEYLNAKKKELSNEEKAILSLLPQLDKMRDMKMKGTKAVTYTGFRGLGTAVDEALDSLQPPDDIVAMGITGRKEEKFNAFWMRWWTRRIKKRIHARHIFSERGSYFHTFKKMKYTEARVLAGITPAAVDVFGSDKVLIFNYADPPSCILISDENTATSFRQFFEQLWKIAK